jgi:hypothetical protein
MDVFFLFLPAAIVLGNYLFSDLRDDSAPIKAGAPLSAPCEAC